VESFTARTIPFRDLCHFRIWQILLQKSAAPDGCPSVIRLRATGFDLPALTLFTQLSRYAIALSRIWRRPGDQRCESSQVLGNGGKNKLILGASRATQPEPAEPQDTLQVREPHLNFRYTVYRNLGRIPYKQS
jgi:hypothetical protein